MGLRRRSRAKTWLAVYVKSRHEKKVAERLQNAGVEVYLPLVEQIRQWSDRRKKIEVPLIPGYLFVCVEQKERDWVVQETGVVAFVRHEGRPAELREQEIEALQFFISNGYSLRLSGEPIEWLPGDVGVISAGVFSGNQVEILKNLGSEEVLLCFEHFNQQVVVRAPQAMIERTKEGAQ